MITTPHAQDTAMFTSPRRQTALPVAIAAITKGKTATTDRALFSFSAQSKPKAGA